MKKKWLLIVFSIVLVMVSAKMSFKNKEIPYGYAREYTYDDMIPLNEIVENMPVKETVQLTQGTYSGLSLRFGTFGRAPEGTITIELRDKTSKETVAYAHLSLSGIRDNEMQKIFFEKSVDIHEEQEYQLYISGEDLKTGKSVTVFAYDSEGENGLYAGKEWLPDKILVMAWYAREFEWKRFWYLVCSLLALEAYLAYVIRVVTEEI